MKRILYVTYLYYKSQDRNYYEEDVLITSYFKEHFELLIARPQQAISFLDIADCVVYRNTGSVLGYADYFKAFLKEELLIHLMERQT